MMTDDDKICARVRPTSGGSNLLRHVGYDTTTEWSEFVRALITLDFQG